MTKHIFQIAILGLFSGFLLSALISNIDTQKDSITALTEETHNELYLDGGEPDGGLQGITEWLVCHKGTFEIWVPILKIQHHLDHGDHIGFCDKD